MTKTFKLSAIFFITTLWLVIMKIVVQFIPLSDNITSWLFSFLVQGIGMGLIPVLLYKQWIKGGDVKEDFHLKAKINPLTYVIAVILGFLLYYVTMGVSLIYQNVLVAFGFQHVSSVGTIYSGIEVLIFELITVGLLAGFFEEFIDRGLLLSVFKNEKNERKIIIIMALVFALGHQNIVQTGYTFIGGLIFAFLAVKTKSIFPSMIMHIINNSLSVLFAYSEQKGGYMGALMDNFYNYLNSNFVIVIASWIAAGFVIIVLLKFIAKINYKEPEAEVQSVEKEGSIYSLFGFPSKRLPYIPPEKSQWWEYGMIFASMLMSFLCTIFTFMWGVFR